MLRSFSWKRYLFTIALLLLFLVALAVALAGAAQETDPASPSTFHTVMPPEVTSTTTPGWWRDLPTPIVIP